MTIVDPHPRMAIRRLRLPDLDDSEDLRGVLVVGDGSWLTIGEVLTRLRAAGYSESESTVRRMIDEGAVESYRTERGGHRRIRAASVDALIAARLGDLGPTEQATRPEPRPVVAAIVTSRLGVLIGRRTDGKPPWTFIAGEIEPGESPADAATREVKEETGLLVRTAEREIGRRVHPKTGRTMIYLSCEPLGKLDVFVGDEDELSEVRWAGLEEAEELLPGIFEPVLVHLRRELNPPA